MNYYVIKVVKAATAKKLRAFPGQFFPDGSEISEKLNVQGDHKIREELGEGGLFIVSDLTNRDKFYAIAGSRIYVTNEEDSEKTGHPVASIEALDYFNELVGGKAKTAKKVVEEFDEDSLLGKIMSDPKLNPPTLEDTGFHANTEDWYLLVRNIKQNISTMLYGPSGTGKTELVELLAEQTGMEINVFDMGSCLDPTATLVGVHRLEDGKSVFDYSRFYHSIQQPGIVLLDELSRAPENTTNLLLPCLDSRRTLYTDVGSSEIAREVPVHPDCVFIATANIGSEYVGTNLLDKALLSRFFKLELDYLGSEEETSVLVERTGVAKKDAKVIVRVCQDIRTDHRKGVLSKDVSTRETLATAFMVKDGFSLTTSLERVLLPNFEGDEGTAGGERQSVMAKIMAI